VNTIGFAASLFGLWKPEIVDVEPEVHEAALGVDERRDAVDRQLGSELHGADEHQRRDFARRRARSRGSCPSGSRASPRGSTMRWIVCHFVAPHA
jgi:hypothetical protein